MTTNPTRGEHIMDPTPTVPFPHNPAQVTAPAVAVRSAYGRLLWDALPLETARQWVAQGKAYVETPEAIRFSPQEDTHG
jgi:hypothetical protein